jgi:mercuric ion binding protein
MRRFTLGYMALAGPVAAGVAFAAPPQTATLAVENMTCGTCPIVVKKALERVPGVTSTTVDFDRCIVSKFLAQTTPDQNPQWPRRIIAEHR